MKIIAVLPTGDWAELTRDNEVFVYEIADKDYQDFQDAGGDTTLGKCIASYSTVKGFEKH